MGFGDIGSSWSESVVPRSAVAPLVLAVKGGTRKVENPSVLQC